MVENIIKANPISFTLMDLKDSSNIQEVGHRVEIEFAVTLDIQWRDSVFNSPDGAQTRFAILKKYKNGWKLEGLGTGP